MITELYRHFDKRGVLLYVGVSLATIKRLHEHKYRDGSWFRRIVRITIERFPNKDVALRAEKLAIEREKPLYNKLYSVLEDDAIAAPNPIARYLSECGKKGGRNRFKGTSFRQRSEMMKKVRAARTAKRKAENGSSE